MVSESVIVRWKSVTDLVLSDSVFEFVRSDLAGCVSYAVSDSAEPPAHSPTLDAVHPDLVFVDGLDLLYSTQVIFCSVSGCCCHCSVAALQAQVS